MNETTVGNLRNVPRETRDKGVTRVDRTTRFGNPYRIGTRDEVCDAYEMRFGVFVRGFPSFRAAVLGLQGKRLYCWCAPERCHADTIAAWLNGKLMWQRIARSIPRHMYIQMTVEDES